MALGFLMAHHPHDAYAISAQVAHVRWQDLEHFSGRSNDLKHPVLASFFKALL